MAIVLADESGASVPVENTKVLVFPSTDGWISQVAYAPANSSMLFWDLGYLYDDLKRVHTSLEFKQIVKEIKQFASDLQILDHLHLRGKVQRPSWGGWKNEILLGALLYINCFVL